MSEPTKEQLDKWRSDFEKEFEIDDISLDCFKREGSYDSFSEDDKWEGYLAAKKSDFEEIKTLKEQLARAEQRIFHAPHCITNYERNECDCGYERYFSEKEKQDKENKE